MSLGTDFHCMSCCNHLAGFSVYFGKRLPFYFKINALCQHRIIIIITINFIIDHFQFAFFYYREVSNIIIHNFFYEVYLIVA